MIHWWELHPICPDDYVRDWVQRATIEIGTDKARIAELERALRKIKNNELDGRGGVRAAAWKDDHIRCAGIARKALEKGGGWPR